MSDGDGSGWYRYRVPPSVEKNTPGETDKSQIVIVNETTWIVPDVL